METLILSIASSVFWCRVLNPADKPGASFRATASLSWGIDIAGCVGVCDSVVAVVVAAVDSLRGMMLLGRVYIYRDRLEGTCNGEQLRMNEHLLGLCLSGTRWAGHRLSLVLRLANLNRRLGVRVGDTSSLLINCPNLEAKERIYNQQRVNKGRHSKFELILRPRVVSIYINGP